jgi:hypothetical protein
MFIVYGLKETEIEFKIKTIKKCTKRNRKGKARGAL